MIVAPEPNTNVPPLASAGRRLLAKSVDSVLFAGLAFIVGRWLPLGEFSLRGIVPTAVTTVWVASFLVAADTVSAQLFGATPGELIAGIRVRMADGSNLTWSMRQDRAVDALVGGTFGLRSLLGCMFRGRPAPYDRDCRVEYLPRSGPSAVVRSVAFGLTLVAALSAAVAVTVLKSLDVDTQVAINKVLRNIGLPVREIWANPVTGNRVLLPEDWHVALSTQSEHLGEVAIEFECRHEDVRCLVQLKVDAWHSVGYLDHEVETDPFTIEENFARIVGLDGVRLLTDHEGVSGKTRLDQLYLFELADVHLPPGHHAAGIGWFTEERYTWTLILLAPRASGSDVATAEAAQSLVWSLIQSTSSANATENP